MSLLIQHIQVSFKIKAFIRNLTLAFCLLLNNQIHAQGVKFVGNKQSIEKRTSLQLFSENSPEFHDNFSLNFDLQISSNGEIGYIFRIKEKEEIPIINLYYDEENNNSIFRLNEEGKYGLITLAFDRERLKQQTWIPIKLNINLKNGEITLKISDSKEQKTKVNIIGNYSPTIIFGKSDYMIDVPSMSIRNLRVGNTSKKYYFPLKESKGNLLHDSESKVFGEVTNGIWLVNNAFNWRKLIQFQSKSESGSEYNPNNKSVYYFNQDSLRIYNVASKMVQELKFSSPCPVKLHRGNTFIDTVANKLYVYETFYNTVYNGATVASLDLNSLTWEVESNDYFNNEINHHGYLYFPGSQNFLVFGGFGDMRYSNQFSTYSIKEKKWHKNISVSGSEIFPRYFTSMGYSNKLKKAFIFGGMGNESGEHIVGRKYFYDLYSFESKSNKIEKLWDIDWNEKPFVPARGLVIPDSNYVYLLGYPEHMTHSFIKLRRFSLKNGEYEQLGDSIPIFSDKISTRAKLYYDDNLKKLISLVQESDDDVRSELSIYSIDFPAISYEELHSFPSSAKKTNIFLIIATALGISLVVGFLIITKKKKSLMNPVLDEVEKEISVITSKPDANCIYLFGDFTLINRQGIDVSHLLSSRLKQVFCLILFHNKETGISSKLLSHLLWPYKPKDKVKTSRGVAISNLRKVLNELDGVEIVYEEGHFKMLFTSDCFCDYHELEEEIKQNSTSLSERFYKIIDRGQFLLGIDDPIFDQIKRELENQLLEILEVDLKNQLHSKYYAKAIHAGESILCIDPLNEFALEKTLFSLHILKNEGKALKIYKKFIEQYELTMGEKYKHSFEYFWKTS